MRNYKILAVLFSFLALEACFNSKPVKSNEMSNITIVKGDYQGTFHLIDLGKVKVHSYMSPENSAFVNTQIIETEKSLIVVDVQFLRPFAAEVIKYIETLNKPIDKVLLSHSHPDHWFGYEAFTKADFYTLPSIKKELEEQGAAIISQNKPALGDLIPDENISKVKVITSMSEVIDGVTFNYQEITEAEASVHLMVHLPEQKVLIAQDLIYNKVFLFNGDKHFEGWLNTIEDLKKIENVELVLCGHGEPADNTIFDEIKKYILTAGFVYGISETGEEIRSKLKTKFPEYRSPLLLDLSNRVSGIDNSKLAMRMSEEVVNKGKYETINELIAEGYIYHGPGGLEMKGREGFKQMISAFRNGFPDLNSEVKILSSAGEYVTLLYTFEGTHKNEAFGIPATGKKINIKGIIMRKFENGQIVEDWDMYDMPTFMKQLGIK